MDFSELYDGIRNGSISRKEARRAVSLEYLKTVNNSIIDIHREIRTGIPEIIYGEYKTEDQVVEIMQGILAKNREVIVSRYPDNANLSKRITADCNCQYSGNILIAGRSLEPRDGNVLVISAGKADFNITEEVRLSLICLGVHPLVFEDRGLAHPTRVIEALKAGIESDVDAVIVIAGMEGALATYVASLIPVPVIGVPTSVGYGFRAGETALTTMLASCMPNLCVVNIDGGIRAAVFAALISKNRK